MYIRMIQHTYIYTYIRMYVYTHVWGERCVETAETAETVVTVFDT